MRFASYPSRPARGTGAKRPKFDGKMTFREILSREEANDDCIWLYREGMFVKAYDRSAFFAYTLIHEFKFSRLKEFCYGLCYKEISVNTYALSSERIVSVSKQLQALRGKVKAEVHEV